MYMLELMPQIKGYVYKATNTSQVSSTERHAVGGNSMSLDWCVSLALP